MTTMPMMLMRNDSEKQLKSSDFLLNPPVHSCLQMVFTALPNRVPAQSERHQ